MIHRHFVSSSTALTVAALCVMSLPIVGQSGYDSSHSMETQHHSIAGNDQHASSVTFRGTVTKSGNRFVLTDADNKTTYQVDDPQKAHDFLNKSVKVTGVLDASTGTIRITAIQLF